MRATALVLCRSKVTTQSIRVTLRRSHQPSSPPPHLTLYFSLSFLILTLLHSLLFSLSPLPTPLSPLPSPLSLISPDGWKITALIFLECTISLLVTCFCPTPDPPWITGMSSCQSHVNSWGPLPTTINCPKKTV